MSVWKTKTRSYCSRNMQRSQIKVRKASIIRSLRVFKTSHREGGRLIEMDTYHRSIEIHSKMKECTVSQLIN